MPSRSATLTLAEQAGAVLARHREDVLKLSRRALAAKHGLASTTLLELEHGRGNPTVGRLADVARDVYGVRLAILEDHNEADT